MSSNPNWPTLTLKAAMGVNPNTSAPAYSLDLATKNRTLTLSRGRQYELDRSEAGELQGALDNTDGAFDPTNPASPNWPNVKIETPIQAQAVWAGKTYSFWTGFIERWPQTWNDPTFGVSNIEGVDALAALANITLDAAYDAEVLLDAPIAYYPLHEGAGATSFANASATLQPDGATVLSKVLGSTGPTFGGATLLAGDGGTSVTGSATAGGTQVDGGFFRVAARGVGPALTLPGGFTIEAVFEASNTDDLVIYSQLATSMFGASGIQLLVVPGNSGGGLIQLSITDDDNTTNVLVTFTGTVSLNHPHHLVATLGTDQATMSLWLDDVNIATANTGTATLSNLPTYSNIFGTGNDAATVRSAITTAARGSNVALYQFPLSNARIGSHYTIFHNAANGETTALRHQRILSYAGWQGPSSTFLTTSLAGPLLSAGANAVDALQLNADSECGVLYVDGSGSVNLAGRQYRETLLPAGAGNPDQTKPEWVCGDGPGEYHYDSAPIFDFDPTYIYNIVEVARTGGLTATAINATSLLEYFPRTLDKTVCLSSDADTTDQTGYLLSRYRQPHIRAETVTFSPAADPNLWPFVLGVEQGDLIKINRRPGNAPMVTVEGFVEQIEHQIQPGQSNPWQVTITVSPIFTYYGRLAAAHGTLHVTAAAHSGGAELSPLPDAATNPAECTIIPGTRITFEPGTANAETVTVTIIGGSPSPRSAPYTFIVLSFTPNLANNHAIGSVWCEALPTGHTDPTDWDAYAVIDDGSGTVGDLVISY